MIHIPYLLSPHALWANHLLTSDFIPEPEELEKSSLGKPPNYDKIYEKLQTLQDHVNWFYQDQEEQVQVHLKTHGPKEKSKQHTQAKETLAFTIKASLIIGAYNTLMQGQLLNPALFLGLAYLTHQYAPKDIVVKLTYDYNKYLLEKSARALKHELKNTPLTELTRMQLGTPTYDTLTYLKSAQIPLPTIPLTRKITNLKDSQYIKWTDL